MPSSKGRSAAAVNETLARDTDAVFGSGRFDDPESWCLATNATICAGLAWIRSVSMDRPTAPRALTEVCWFRASI
jgi:hypothetical protein